MSRVPKSHFSTCPLWLGVRPVDAFVPPASIETWSAKSRSAASWSRTSKLSWWPVGTVTVMR